MSLSKINSIICLCTIGKRRKIEEKKSIIFPCTLPVQFYERRERDVWQISNDYSLFSYKNRVTSHVNFLFNAQFKSSNILL